jgi:hypothetical protein
MGDRCCAKIDWFVVRPSLCGTAGGGVTTNRGEITHVNDLPKLDLNLCGLIGQPEVRWAARRSRQALGAHPRQLPF